MEVQNAINPQYKFPQNLKIIFMQKSTNKSTNCKLNNAKNKLHTAVGGQHRTQGSIKKYNFEYIHTFEQLGVRSSAKVSLHITGFSQGMWLYSSLKCVPEMPKA